LNFSRLQLLALLDVLLTYGRDKDKPQVFRDLATDSEISVGDLATMVTEEILARRAA